MNGDARAPAGDSSFYSDQSTRSVLGIQTTAIIFELLGKLSRGFFLSGGLSMSIPDLELEHEYLGASGMVFQGLIRWGKHQ